MSREDEVGLFPMALYVSAKFSLPQPTETFPAKAFFHKEIHV